MNEVKDKVWFLREGLFAKYVVALVGLVVFVLAVNGAMEIWISYRGIKTSLADGMSEKAEATAKRIEQSMSDLERQISWVTRASSTTIEERRADYAQLLQQVPQVSQLSLLNGQGREQLRLHAPDRHARQRRRFLPRHQVHRDRRARHQLCAGLFPGPAARSCRSRLAHSGSMPASPSPRSTSASSPTIFGDAQVGKVAFAYVVDPQGPGAGEFGQGAGGRQGSFRAAAGRRRDSRPAARR